jgi:ADP-ribosyl-[dinitrogen reductase] hydrolase
VIHTLESSLWCLLNTDNYKDAVLKAANLGHDTDTTAAVTGGLAGLLYGWQSIPQEWLAVLAKRTEIEGLITRLNKKLHQQ